VIVFLMVLDNFGVNITALVASLGVGGIAVALAVQNILGDLFASLSITLDKPFEIGDFIIVGDVLGAVEHIGLKTTRLRGLGGEQVVFSNGDLLKSRIHNHKRMETRRVAFVLRIAYGTSEEQLCRVPRMVREIIAAKPNGDFERAHFFSWASGRWTSRSCTTSAAPTTSLHMDAQQDGLPGDLPPLRAGRDPFRASAVDRAPGRSTGRPADRDRGAAGTGMAPLTYAIGCCKPSRTHPTEPQRMSYTRAYACRIR
jgi:small-conductance mechanosensitive channel